MKKVMARSAGARVGIGSRDFFAARAGVAGPRTPMPNAPPFDVCKREALWAALE